MEPQSWKLPNEAFAKAYHRDSLSQEWQDKIQTYEIKRRAAGAYLGSVVGHDPTKGRNAFTRTVYRCMKCSMLLSHKSKGMEISFDFYCLNVISLLIVFYYKPLLWRIKNHAPVNDP